MASSLQEQLLKAGLVSEQRLKQTKTKKRKQKRSGTAPSNADQQQGARVAAEKKRHDQELNRRREEERQRKAAQIAAWQLVRDNRVPREVADTPYNFADGSALKRLYVSAEQHRGLVDGKLAIVRHDDFVELVPARIAERVAETDPALVLVLNRPDAGAEDDEYADYKVPDDLMW